MYFKQIGNTKTDHNDSDFIDNNVFFVNTDSESDLLRESVTGDKKINNLESDVSGLINLREEFPNNPMIGYLNINSLGNQIKIFFVKCFLNAQLTLCVLTKLKLILPFPMSSFILTDINFHLSVEIEIKRAKGKLFL